MKALILGAGYATRLYPLTKDRPKPLLPVADRPMIGYIVDKIAEVNEIDHLYVVTNHKFIRNFEDWKKTLSLDIPVTILDDGTTSDADKLGAIGDMKFVIGKEKVEDDLLVVAGDNLFDFKIKGFIDFFRSKNSRPSITLYDVEDIGLVKKYSVITLDEKARIINFEEKPQHPKTTLIAICLYLFPKDTLPRINEYLEKGLNPDAPGYFVSWLSREEAVYGYKVSGRWYDIGGFDAYHKADEEYRGLRCCTDMPPGEAGG